MSTCPEQLQNPDLRRYELIPKHGPGGFGTLMDLDDATAQQVLQAALHDPSAADQGCPNLWGYHGGKVYRFMCNNSVPALWHGYPTEEKPPTSVMRRWLEVGTITQAEYGKLRRRVGRGS